eukprot:6201647-Pleurochrysis_carterae.AAC.5
MGWAGAGRTKTATTTTKLAHTCVLPTLTPRIAVCYRPSERISNAGYNAILPCLFLLPGVDGPTQPEEPAGERASAESGITRMDADEAGNRVN